MKTLKLFQNDVYLSHCTSTVMKTDGDLVALDETVFFPEGGGQSCDKGTINGCDVTHVKEKDGIVWHKVPGHSLTDGDTAECSIDWEHRFDNMQRHLGEHIVSGMWYRAFGGVNMGFHMGDEYMTIDIGFPDDKNLTATMEMAMQVEDMANSIIWRDLPVNTVFCRTAEEASVLHLRKKPSVSENITVVSVGDPSDPEEAVACCGTHPSTTGQVGLVRIFKVEKNKNMYRVYLEAGRRALLDCRKKDRLLTELAGSFSTAPESLWKKIQADRQKYQDLSARHAILRNSVISQRRDEILKIKDDKIIHMSWSDLDTDDLMHLGQPLGNEIAGILILEHQPSSTVLLFSSGVPDCSRLVKDNASVFRGKGGGRKEAARAIFPDEENMNSFIISVKNLLR